MSTPALNNDWPIASTLYVFVALPEAPVQYDLPGQTSAVAGSNFTPFFAQATMCALESRRPVNAGVSVNVTAGSDCTVIGFGFPVYVVLAG